MKVKVFLLTILTVFSFVVVPCALAGPVSDRCASRYGYGNQAFRDCMRRHTGEYPRRDYRSDYRRGYRSDYRRGPSSNYRQRVAERCGSRWGYNNRNFRDCMRRHSGQSSRRW